MIHSKQLVRGAFASAELPRLPFIPWVFSHAARLEQMPLRRMYAEPTQYTKCLQNGQKLYGYDCIAGSFDASLETEVCGRPVKWGGDYETPAIVPDSGFDLARLDDIDVESAARTGRFGTVVEALRRINKVAGANIALAAVVTGPLTLTAVLTGRDPLRDLAERPEEAIRDIEAVVGFLLKIIQVYCQLEPDIIAIADRLMAGLPSASVPRLGSLFSPVINTVRFYNAFSVLLPGAASPENIAGLIDLGCDGVVAPGIDAAIWNDIRAGRPCVLGKAVPTAILSSDVKELQEYLEKHIPGKTESGVFLTTEWEVPPDMPPDSIHLVMHEISRR